MPTSPADMAKKLSAVITDKAATEAEKQNATRRLGELLAKHPEVLAQANAKAKPGSGTRRQQTPKKPKDTPTGQKRQRVAATNAAKAMSADIKALKRAARVIGKAAGHLGQRKTQMGVAAFIDLLDEWEKG